MNPRNLSIFFFLFNYRLINNLRNHAEENWHLGNLICQVIWNYCVDEKDLFSVLGDPQSQSLMNILIDLLGKIKFYFIFNNLVFRSFCFFLSIM